MGVAERQTNAKTQKYISMVNMKEEQDTNVNKNQKNERKREGESEGRQMKADQFKRIMFDCP